MSVKTKADNKRIRFERKATPNISRVKELRENHRLSQKEVAKVLGIGQVAYSQKENGKTKFSLREAKMLAMLFNTNIEALFFEPILNAI